MYNNLNHIFEKPLFNKLLGIFAVVIVCVQILWGSILIWQNTHEFPVISAISDDSASTFGYANGTRFSFHDPKWGYGPSYLRVSKVLYYLISIPVVEISTQEKLLHFALSYISFLSFIGVAFLISGQISKITGQKFLIMFLILSAILNTDVFAEYIIMLKPDALLAFILLCALLLSTKMIEENYRVKSWNFAGSAFLWAFAVTVKISALVFIPPLIFLFLPPLSFQNIKKGFLYFLSFFVFFNISWFPFKWFKLIPGSMGKIDGVSMPNDLENVQAYFINYLDQVWFILLVVLLGYIASVRLFNQHEQFFKMRRFGAAALFMIPVIGFLFFIRKKLPIPIVHYTIPVVILTVYCFLYLIDRYRKAIAEKLNDGKYPDQYLIVILVAGSVAAFAYSGFGLSLLERKMDSNWKCSKEAKEVVSIYPEYLKKGYLLITDPYTPKYNTLPENTPARFLFRWGVREKDIPSNAPVLLVLKKTFYHRYLPENVTEGLKILNPDYLEKYSFYKQFYKKTNEFTDSAGNHWIPVVPEVSMDNCGFELWKKEK